MPSRDALHELVDKLPEAALEATERVLNNYQTWPSRPPMTIEKMRERVYERFRNHSGKSEAHGGKGFIGGYVGGGSSTPDGDGMSSMSTMDGPDFVNFEVRVFRGHRLELEERLRLSDDGKLLRYSQQIGGPDGKTNHYELEFNVAEGNSPVNGR
jgi:hypothetical protein